MKWTRSYDSVDSLEQDKPMSGVESEKVSPAGEAQILAARAAALEIVEARVASGAGGQFEVTITGHANDGPRQPACKFCGQADPADEIIVTVRQK